MSGTRTASRAARLSPVLGVEVGGAPGLEGGVQVVAEGRDGGGAALVEMPQAAISTLRLTHPTHAGNLSSNEKSLSPEEKQASAFSPRVAAP